MSQLDYLTAKNTFFTEHPPVAAFISFERILFETTKKHIDCSFKDSGHALNKFDKRLFKSTVMSDDILAQPQVTKISQFIQLSSYHEELVKATIPDLQYNIIERSVKEDLQ